MTDKQKNLVIRSITGREKLGGTFGINCIIVSFRFGKILV